MVDLEHLGCYLTNAEMILFSIAMKRGTSPKE